MTEKNDKKLFLVGLWLGKICIRNNNTWGCYACLFCSVVVPEEGFLFRGNLGRGMGICNGSVLFIFFLIMLSIEQWLILCSRMRLFWNLLLAVVLYLHQHSICTIRWCCFNTFNIFSSTTAWQIQRILWQCFKRYNNWRYYRPSIAKGYALGYLGGGLQRWFHWLWFNFDRHY